MAGAASASSQVKCMQSLLERRMHARYCYMATVRGRWTDRNRVWTRVRAYYILPLDGVLLMISRKYLRLLRPGGCVGKAAAFQKA